MYKSSEKLWKIEGWKYPSGEIEYRIQLKLKGTTIMEFEPTLSQVETLQKFGLIKSSML